MVLLIALIAIWLASNPNSLVLGLVAYAWAGFGAAFGPVIILSVFWKRMTGKGALAGMIVGAIVVVLWKNSGINLYEIVPGFIACFVTIILVSLFGGEPPKAVVKKFEEADKAYRAEV